MRSLPCSSLCLFKAAGGAKIVNNDLIVSKKVRCWNLGNDLSLHKKNPSSVLIGVAYAIDRGHSDDSDGLADLEAHDVSKIKYTLIHIIFSIP